MTSLNKRSQSFNRALSAIKAREQKSQQLKKSETIHVIGAGRTLTSAYEQLRNAAEYTEEHLLLQRAIRRFYKRLFVTQQKNQIRTSGEELVTELTLGGYLANDTVPIAVAKVLSERAEVYYLAYLRLRQQSAENHESWVVDVLAVEAESLIHGDELQDVFVQYAFDYFNKVIDQDSVFAQGSPSDFELALYVAIHRMLLKSDTATVRYALLRRFRQDPAKLASYIETNKQIDNILAGKTVEKLARIVNRYGAVLRLLWRTLNEQPQAADLIYDQQKFLTVYEAQISSEYSQIRQRIDRGIVKSVIFLIISKFLVGIAIEIPYDLLVHDSILWLPLIVNLLLPPLYMVSLRYTLRLPRQDNTYALVEQAKQLLYGDESEDRPIKVKAKQHGTAFNVAYGLAFIIIFGGVSAVLAGIGFDIVHLLIFFIFFSAASFLGFRLSRVIREVETVDGEQGGVAVLRDFIYLPFVVVGQKLNEGYSRFNIMALVLDMAIDLPLKTVLRLIRQWGTFISSKKDEL